MRQTIAWFQRKPAPLREVLVIGCAIAAIAIPAWIAAATFSPPSPPGPEPDLQRETGLSTPSPAGIDRGLPAFPAVAESPSVASAVQERVLTGIPEGKAPLGVRRAWVGVGLEDARLLENVFARGLVTGRIEGPADYWAVDPAPALRSLAEKDRAAAEWFRREVSFHPGEMLMFKKGSAP